MLVLHCFEATLASEGLLWSWPVSAYGGLLVLKADPVRAQTSWYAGEPLCWCVELNNSNSLMYRNRNVIPKDLHGIQMAPQPSLPIAGLQGITIHAWHTT